MSPIKPEYRAHQQKRWIRHDAFRFIRPDWRRFVKPGSEAAAHFERYERKYRPDQLRDDHGRWADEGRGTSRRASKIETTEFSAASRKGGVGHHELPQAIYKKLPLPEETRKVFDEATTGPIPSRGHRWDSAHRDYNEAVGELIENFMAKNNVRREQMTPEQAESLLKAVRESPDPRIGNYNKGIRMLQFMYRLRTGTLRGNE